MDPPAYLSVEQVRLLLPDVKVAVEKIVYLKKEIDLLKTININSEHHDINVDITIMDLNQKYHKKMHLFYKEMVNLIKLGGILKDPNIGLVDFYSRINESDIFLCWKLGEDDIYYWHELDSGFSARKSISLLNDA